ncbi:MAG TPA: zf-HC2 domain-containing protein [Fimbriimonas sp.]|nr:zf-HC2 domain-containing protein [Fimbriimonas sp.]
MTCQQARPWIGAWIDGELDLMQSAELRKHLAECQSCSEELEALRALRESIRKVSPSKVSEELRDRVARSIPPAAMKRRISALPLGFAFVGGVVVAVVGTALWNSRASTHSALVAELMQSHVRSLMPNHLLDVVSTDQHTVKPWFDGKTSISPTPFQLRTEGFPLLGGRLDLIEGQRVPVFVYGRRKHLINLFVFPASGATMWLEDRQGYHLLSWNEGELEYVAVSDVDSSDLKQFKADYQTAEGK